MSVGSAPKTSELDLRAYLHVVARRKWVIIVITLVAASSAFLLSDRQTPRYRSTTELLFRPSAADMLSTQTNAGGFDPRVLASQQKVIRGPAVRARVTEVLGSAPQIKLGLSQQENVISITAESTDRRRAAAIAETYAQAYIEHRRDSQFEESLAAQKLLQSKIDEVRLQIDERNRQAAALPREQQGLIDSERTALISSEFQLRQQLSQLQLRGDLAGGGVEVVTEARPAPEPFAPKPKRTAALAASLGLMFALGLAFFVDFLDDTIKSKEDLERAAPGVPMIGSIPAFRGVKQGQIMSLEAPTSAFAEAFRSLRTAIQFLALDQKVGLLQVTSPAAGEGKSTTVANLAVSFAKAGRRAVVVDCDLRRPRVHQFFGVSSNRGFTNVLLDEVPLRSAPYDGPTENLKILPAGELPPNPSELLSSRRAAETLGQLRGQSEIVIVDSPPVLPVTDAVILSQWVDATICVVSVGQTTRRQLHRTVEMLSGLNVKLVGIVLNGVTSRSSEYAYSYTYGYSARAEDPGGRRPSGGRPARRNEVGPDRSPNGSGHYGDERGGRGGAGRRPDPRDHRRSDRGA